MPSMRFSRRRDPTDMTTYGETTRGISRVRAEPGAACDSAFVVCYIKPRTYRVFIDFRVQSSQIFRFLAGQRCIRNRGRRRMIHTACLSTVSHIECIPSFTAALICASALDLPRKLFSFHNFHKECSRSGISDEPIRIHVYLPSDLLSLFSRVHDFFQTFTGYMAQHL